MELEDVPLGSSWRRVVSTGLESEQRSFFHLQTSPGELQTYFQIHHEEFEEQGENISVRTPSE